MRGLRDRAPPSGVGGRREVSNYSPNAADVAGVERNSPGALGSGICDEVAREDDDANLLHYRRMMTVAVERRAGSDDLDGHIRRVGDDVVDR